MTELRGRLLLYSSLLTGSCPAERETDRMSEVTTTVIAYHDKHLTQSSPPTLLQLLTTSPATIII